jgi:ATP-dependent protease HslVU (ClpYQ) peptidase subunit
MANRKTIYVTANGQMAFGRMRITKSHDGKRVLVFTHKEIAGLTNMDGEQMYEVVGDLWQEFPGWTLKEVAERMQNWYGEVA